MGHVMDSEKEEIKKYLKTSSIKAEFDSDEEGPKIMTNIEAFHEGRFPRNLAEKFESPPTLESESLLNNIKLCLYDSEKRLRNGPFAENARGLALARVHHALQRSAPDNLPEWCVAC